MSEQQSKLQTISPSASRPTNYQTNNTTSDSNASIQRVKTDRQSDSVLDNSIIRDIPENSTLKDQKKHYNLKKKCFSKNIQSAIDSAQEIHSGWLKARTTFKRWTKVWCQLKPGYLIIYTSQEAQKKHRIGVVILSVCQVIKRPTKKDGYCFKLINPFGYHVWAKSSTKAFIFSHASLTLRASDALIGKLWLDAMFQCNLSSNLDGYQPIVEEAIEATESMRSNRSNLSYSDDGEISTRQLDGLLSGHSDSASNNNSVVSFNDNCQRGSGQPITNGNGGVQPLRSSTFKAANKPLVNQNHNNNNYSNQTVGDKLTSIRNLGRPSSQLGKTDGCNYYDKPGALSSVKKTESEHAINNHDDSRIGPKMNSSKMVAKFCKYNWKELKLEKIHYEEDEVEELGCAGIQTEEVHDSHKNIIWHIIKQLGTGTDLSKVTLPTFILEPRSFLEKLADYYYHSDILSEAVMIDDPVQRMVNIVKWYLSGFYKKPKGPKKPYNPILGERFRCFWDHPKTQSRTFFVAEQVSHHPPISAFHVSNKKDGFVISCSLLTKSKFSGNSVQAIMNGKARLHLNKRGETYTLTMPYANCRGIVLGSLCLELGGKVEIECLQTSCKCELDFKLAPVWGSSNSYNELTGKIFKDSSLVYTLDGHWDKKINILNKKTDKKSVLWEVTDAVRNSRLKRYSVSLNDQGERESVKLWSKVTEALQGGDQTIATVEKTKLEDMQRREARDRKSPHIPKSFVQARDSTDWTYKWMDQRAWDERRDIMQFEDEFKIRTLTFRASGSDGSDSKFDPSIDMPLTQINKFSGQTNPESALRDDELQGSAASRPSSRGPMNQDPYESIESRIEAENMLIKQAIARVTEKNKALENDLAALKRGKKAIAFVIAAVIVALLSVLFRYLS